MKIKKEDLLFLPLGGSNEIGMNANLYHYQGKWLMIDLGAGFADARYPGVQMLAPDLEFLYERLDNFLGIVLTHAHEDHIGSVGYLWDRLRCPIYASPFTAAMVKGKLKEAGYESECKINIIEDSAPFNIGPFELDPIHITHSIPEMNAIILRTEYGNIVHSGDWKLDPNPVVCDGTDEIALKKIGEEGALALVCDSTNVFTEKHSGSEGDLIPSLTELISEAKGAVFVTTFASNVARIDTLARIAKKCGRKIVLAGLSVQRISNYARECGYLQDVEPFLPDKAFNSVPRKNVMVICTGCQGETNAAMTKIAEGRHHTIKVTPQDRVIFSSKIIPGNDKKIFRLFNTFVRKNIEVITEKDHFVHVSGHPSRPELRQMYDWVKPEIVIPVHGEAVHLHEHRNFAKECGIKSQVELQNGEVIRLAPGKPQSLGMVTTGYLAVDGYSLQPEKGHVMESRRKLQDNGVVIISLVMSHFDGLQDEPLISTPGIIDAYENPEIIDDFKDEIINILNSQKKWKEAQVVKAVRKAIKAMIKNMLRKFPLVEIHVHFVD